MDTGKPARGYEEGTFSPYDCTAQAYNKLFPTGR